jgi:hypothetical protein
VQDDGKMSFCEKNYQVVERKFTFLVLKMTSLALENDGRINLSTTGGQCLMCMDKRWKSLCKYRELI